MSPQDLIATPWRADGDYDAYVQAQVSKTRRKRQHCATRRLFRMCHRLRRFVEPNQQSVLSVGCRNSHELQMLRTFGYVPTGMDLVALEPGIFAMDMHDMPAWEDNEFDGLFSCHSLEHAYDVTQALKEFARVVKPGGFWAIEVPINYTTTDVDRQDFKSLDGLREAVSPYTSELHGEDCGTVARYIGLVK